MKCHEFIEAAECLTPSQLSSMRADDSPMMVACPRMCGVRTLAGVAVCPGQRDAVTAREHCTV